MYILCFVVGFVPDTSLKGICLDFLLVPCKHKALWVCQNIFAYLILLDSHRKLALLPDRWTGTQ